nr:uncharacterized protein LOC112941536 [Solanum lycopersicum]
MTIPIFALITTIVQSHHFSFSFFLILLVSPTTKYPYEINNDYVRRGNMEGGAITTKDMKVEINSSTEPENISPPSENVTTGGLARQGSMSKNNCLCSPTTHAGSFRCRLHRAPTMTNPNLQRTKSIESNPNKANPNAYTTS